MTWVPGLDEFGLVLGVITIIVAAVIVTQWPFVRTDHGIVGTWSEDDPYVEGADMSWAFTRSGTFHNKFTVKHIGGYCEGTFSVCWNTVTIRELKATLRKADGTLLPSRVGTHPMTVTWRDLDHLMARFLHN